MGFRAPRRSVWSLVPQDWKTAALQASLEGQPYARARRDSAAIGGPTMPAVDPWPQGVPLPPLQRWLPELDPIDRARFGWGRDPYADDPIADQLSFLESEAQGHPWRSEFESPRAWEEGTIPIGYPEEPIEVLLARLAQARQRGYNDIQRTDNKSYHDATSWLVARSGGVADRTDPIAFIRALQDVMLPADAAHRRAGLQWETEEGY